MNLQATFVQNNQLQWLDAAAWRAAFGHIQHSCSYAQHLPNAILARLCAPGVGQLPAQVVVEQPWQAQWVSQQSMAYLSAAGVTAAPLPQVLTLSQWLNLDDQLAQLDEAQVLSERQAALSLCQAFKALNVDSLRNDAARHALALEMVSLLKEIDTRAGLSPALAFAGQDCGDKLLQTTWLSREARWLSAARGSLLSMGKPAVWQLRIQASKRLAASAQLLAVLPAAHPSLAMQLFLSQWPQTQTASLCLPLLADAAQSAQKIAHIQVFSCEHFEQEARDGAALIQSLMRQNDSEHTASSVAVVAHDRVLARRCAALLARNRVPVEDRVGWALSTTVASTLLRGVLTSWQASDPQALMQWLALPIVADHWPQARASLAYLRRLWFKQPLLPEGRAFMRRAIAQAPDPDILRCLQHWQAAQQLFTKPKTLAQFAGALQAFLAPLSDALQSDAAGGKVWQQLVALTMTLDDAAISLATFIAVLDDALESERFSASSHSHNDVKAGKVVFIPLYEAAWIAQMPLVMLGCNEAHFPASPSSPTPMLSSVRRELGLPSPSAERAVWQHLLQQKDKPIYATFTPSEGGNPSRLSPYLLGANLQAIAQPAQAAPFYPPNPPNPPTPTKTQTTAAQLTVQSLPLEVSVTKLAAVLQCPYRFALQAVFGIAPLDEPSLWPTHLERGNLLHEALHRAKEDLQTLDNAPALETQLKATLQAMLQDTLPLSGRYAALVADSQRTLSTYIAAHQARQDEGWRMHATEHDIDSEQLIEGVRVHGKLDRLDVVRDKAGTPQGYAVLDYKTSNDALLRQKRDDPLLDAQLALYAALLEHQDLPAAQAAYWRLHDGLHDGLYDGLQGHRHDRLSDASASKADYSSKKTIFELDDLPLQIDLVQHAVRTAWQVLASTAAAPATPSEMACQYCSYHAVCRSRDLAQPQLPPPPQTQGERHE